MPDNPNTVQDELLSQIEVKRKEVQQIYEKYVNLIQQINNIKFKSEGIIIDEVPEERDDDDIIIQERIAKHREIVFIRPRTRIAPIRDLTDDEITKGYEAIKTEFESN